MSLCFLEGPEAGTGNWRGMDPKNCTLLWFCTWWSWWWWGGETSLVCFGGDLVNMFVVLAPLQQPKKKRRTTRIKIVFASWLVLDLQFREDIWWIKDWSRLEKIKTRARERERENIWRVFEWKYVIFKRVFLLLMGDGMKKRRLWIVDSKIYGHIKRERERDRMWLKDVDIWFYLYAVYLLMVLFVCLVFV